MSAAVPGQSSESLQPYLDTPLRLFIFDPNLRKLLTVALFSLGFKNISEVKVQSNFYQAIKQLFGEILNFEGLLLVNQPPLKAKNEMGQAYSDMAFSDFYGGVLTILEQGHREPLKFLSRVVPVFYSAQDSDIRTRTITELFRYGIIGAFMLRMPDLGMAVEEQVAETSYELSEYFVEFFLQRDHKLAEFKEYKSSEELRERRAEADKLRAEVEALKTAKDFDKAIALCRRIIEVLPTDPEAYLEGGRLLVKKKKYPPALQMFRDAEEVAQDLPAPNQEIGNLRVAQVKDYIDRQKEAGQPLDQEKLTKYLAEAVDSFQAALRKASNIQTPRADEQNSLRREAKAAIAENILTLELETVLGTSNPFFREMGRLAHDALAGHAGEMGELPPGHLIKLGLLAFHEKDFTKARENLLKAAAHPEVFQDACTKLNYMGTQLRKMGQLDQALEVYQGLLGLGPSFRGVVLYNLAVASEAKALELKAADPAGAASWEQKAAGTAVEAIYVDPALPKEENFYQTGLMAPVLKKVTTLFSAVVAQEGCTLDDTDRECLAAREEVEALVREGNDREALQLMFGYASTLPKFFSNFDNYASEAVLEFAEKIQPALLKNAKPQMATFGKILGVLITRGRKVMSGGSASQNPMLAAVEMALGRADQALASRLLATILYANPQVVKDAELCTNRNLVNLCSEIQQKLSRIDPKQFKPAEG
ncbi:MAG: hypothetical protein KQJ78_24925 [Deltaproteobacteria bacterium]|nr:hypothetical protein [Deltaproteobacteria bacterium]